MPCVGRGQQYIFCVSHWAVRPPSSIAACKRPWSSSHWSHRTALCGCLKRLQCNLHSALGPKISMCPHFLPSRRALCTYHPRVSFGGRLSSITVENMLPHNVIWKSYRTCRLLVLVTNLHAWSLKRDLDGLHTGAMSTSGFEKCTSVLQQLSAGICVSKPCQQHVFPCICQIHHPSAAQEQWESCPAWLSLLSQSCSSELELLKIKITQKMVLTSF